MKMNRINCRQQRYKPLPYDYTDKKKKSDCKIEQTQTDQNEREKEMKDFQRLLFPEIKVNYIRCNDLNESSAISKSKEAKYCQSRTGDNASRESHEEITLKEIPWRGKGSEEELIEQIINVRE